MPPIFGAIGVAIATAAATSIAVSSIVSGIITAIIGTAISLGISAIASALSPSPKTKMPTLEARRMQTTVTVRDPVRSRDLVFGRARKGGVIVFLGTTNSNHDLHIVIVLAAHKVHAIKEIYFGEEIAFDASGTVVSKYSGKAWLTKHLGEPDQAADADLVSDISGWTTNHRLRGIAYIRVKLAFDSDLYPNLPNISAVLEGMEIYDPRIDATAYSDNAALCQAAYLAHQLYGLGSIYGDEIDLEALAAAANICDELVAIPASSNAVQIDATETRVQAATPCFTLLDVGQPILIQGAGAGGANLQTVIATYVSDTEIDVEQAASTSVAAAPCSWGSGWEKRYTLNGIVDSADEPGNNLERMLSASVGKAFPTGEKIFLMAASYQEPIIELDEDDLRGNLGVQTTLAARDSFNSVRGIFVSEKNQSQPADFPPVKSAAFLAQDNGVRSWKDIELHFTRTETMAQRIAKMDLAQARLQTSVIFPCSLRALDIRGGDTVMVTNARLGWLRKPFAVTSWAFAVSEQRGDPELIINLELRETSPYIFDVTADDQLLLPVAQRSAPTAPPVGTNQVTITPQDINSPNAVGSQPSAGGDISTVQGNLTTHQADTAAHGLGIARVTGSDFTTASGTLVDVTGLSLAVAANSVYEVIAELSVNDNDVDGIDVAVGFSAAGASFEGAVRGAKVASGTPVTERLTAVNAATTSHFIQAAADGNIRISGVVRTGANSGNVTVQASTQGSDTATVRVDSYLKIQKVKI